MAFLANQAFDIVKGQLMENLQQKLQEQLQNNGDLDAVIDPMFESIKQNEKLKKLINISICNTGQKDAVSTALKDIIKDVEFTNDLETIKKNMKGIQGITPEMTSTIDAKIDALPATLKQKLTNLIDQIIVCPAPATSGGKRARNTKRKHRKKTRKHYKKSQCRK